MTTAEEREQRLKLLEDDIGRHLADAHTREELQRAPSFGKPLHFGDGYDETPDELRMGMKILKDAGVVPPEVELMRQIEALQAQVEATPEGEREGPAARAGRQRLAEMRQALALRLEALRTRGF